MKKNKYLLIFYVTSIILIIYSLTLLINYFLENKTNKSIVKHLVEITNIEKTYDKFPYITTNLEKLIEENNDTIGWLQVPNTNINYPVVQSKDNNYYLDHNFNKEKNSSGWIFLDYRNDTNILDSNTIIYGHNRLDNSMFGTLKDTLDESYYKNNKYIFFNTKNTSLTFEIFSIYKVEKDKFKSSINFKSDKDFNNYLEDIKNKSIYNFNVDLTYNDKIITLYTCSNNNEYRTILHAKLIQEKES